MFHDRNDAFCGLWATIVTAPWSLILFTVIIIPMDTLFPNNTLFNSMIPGTIIIILSALVNAYLIFFANKKFYIKPSNDA